MTVKGDYRYDHDARKRRHFLSPHLPKDPSADVEVVENGMNGFRGSATAGIPKKKKEGRKEKPGQT